MTQDQIAITAEPTSEASCRFTVDRPLYPDRSFFFGSKEQAEGSPLAERLFQLDGVNSVLISHNQVTVTKAGFEPWQVIGRQIGAALREHMASGQPPVAESVRDTIPSAEEIREKVQQVLDTQINPGVAAHGGFIRLIDVKDNVVYIQMGGGCQGCGMADVTLKQGVEKAVRFAVPGVAEILDVTDHASGRNPYYTPSRK
jgi:Fe-S cluster biogenesis protein NfuA